MTLSDTLHTLLKNNIVRFTFRKKDGTIRKAVGTRNLDIARAKTGAYIPNPKGEEQPNSYFDTEKMGWRSYKPELVISIDGVFPVEYVDLRENPVREIPVQKGIEVELPPSFGKGTAEKIREEIEKLGKDIEIPVGGGFGFGIPMGGFGGGAPMGGGKPTGGKVGQPMDTGYGVALPISGVRGAEMGIEDFAKIVAKYVVAELIDRLTK